MTTLTPASRVSNSRTCLILAIVSLTPPVTLSKLISRFRLMIPCSLNFLVFLRYFATSLSPQTTTHPSLRHLPPILFFSISVTSAPSSDASIAAVLPAGPPPITTMFIFSSSRSLQNMLFIIVVQLHIKITKIS